MPLATHVLRRGGVYCFRVRIPTHLRHLLGRRELWRSLRTTSPDEARRRCSRLQGLTAGLWNALERAMTPEDAKTLVNAWLQAKLDEDADIRDMPVGEEHRIVVFRQTEPWRPDEVVRKLDQTALAELIDRDPMLHTLYGRGERASKDLTDRDILRQGFRKPLKDAESRRLADDDTVARPLVRSLLKDAGLELDEDTDGFRAAVRFMMGAQRDLLLAVLDRDDHDWRRWSGDDPAEALTNSLGHPQQRSAAELVSSAVPMPTTPAVAPVASGGVMLADAAEAYIAESLANKAFKPSRADEVRSAVKTFSSWLEHPPSLVEITPAIAGEFRKQMAFYPVNGSKRPEYRDLAVGDRIKKSRASSEAKLITRVTLNGKYLDPLRGLWDWAITSGQASTNPFIDIKVKVPRKAGATAKSDRPDFSVAQLKALFSSTVFTGSEGVEGKPLYRPGSERVDDWRYWLPVMGLFSGARLNELCGLRLADFAVREAADYFHVHAGADGQSIKTQAANRLVPVHPKLIELGLMERVAALRASGEDRLFPNLHPGPRGYLSAFPSKFFGKLIDRMLGDDSEVVFHSFRHTFISALRRAGVEREVRVAIVGHDEADSIRNDVHDTYGEEAFNRVVDAVRKVEWPGLDLTAIKLPRP